MRIQKFQKFEFSDFSKKNPARAGNNINPRGLCTRVRSDSRRGFLSLSAGALKSRGRKFVAFEEFWFQVQWGLVLRLLFIKTKSLEVFAVESILAQGEAKIVKSEKLTVVSDEFAAIFNTALGQQWPSAKASGTKLIIGI